MKVKGKMKRILVSLVLSLVMMFLFGMPVLANTQEVEVTATPSYVSINNAPTSWAIGAVTENVDENTGNGHFTITNGSSVNIDISFYVSDNWTHTTGSNDWTYGAPAANTGRLKVSSANGGVGGSGGAGTYDKTLAWGSGASVLVCDNVTTVTNPTWEMELDAPSTFTHGDAQSANITMSAVSE